MSGNSFGKALVLTTFGESHGVAVGGVLDGFPAGIAIDTDYLQSEMDRRRPGLQAHSTPRREEDRDDFTLQVTRGRLSRALGESRLTATEDGAEIHWSLEPEVVSEPLDPEILPV